MSRFILTLINFLMYSSSIYPAEEIKSCGLGSRIRDMEAETVKVPKCVPRYDIFGL